MANFLAVVARGPGSNLVGDGKALLNMAQTYVGRTPDGTYSNMVDASNAVHCSDLRAPGTEIQAAISKSVSTKYPFFGAILMNDMLYCTYWPVAPTQPPRTVRAVGAPPMVVGNTGDPATPYAWAQRLVAELDAAFLVTFRSGMHTAAGASTRAWMHATSTICSRRRPGSPISPVKWAPSAMWQCSRPPAHRRRGPPAPSGKIGVQRPMAPG